ncbi:MAG: 3-oxoacyl-[acyl-carrier-protein] reductase [Streptococcaceae bacterium]|jgi:3-oxoacyl-[acyl-carrier protein] reductase|nr:3-oxoacyl-[acyl-carrier-protein] reductase [Streptococcaceae bacterium]
MNGKNVLITGSARGIGMSLALQFAKQGANIVLNGIEDTPTELMEEIKALGVNVTYAHGDISKFEEAGAVIKTAEEFGPIDVLVNNAGITKDNLLIRMTEADFEKVLKVNLVGTFNMTQQMVKLMMKRRSGAIINIASVSGLIGNVGQANYAASKAGVVGFTKTVAREVAARGITVNAIAPGFINTEMTAVLSDKIKESMTANIPMKRFGETEEIAQAALFLANASYVTGQVLNVDGGMVMNG